METTQLPLDFSTRNFAYHTLENKEKKKAVVLEVIQKLGRCSQAEIATYLGWEINRITGRVDDLVKDKKIRVASRKMGRYNRPVNVYEAIK